MRCVWYNAGIMTQKTLQITVRGLDERTKELLELQAARKGVSMNGLALESLRQTAGTEDSETRYKRMAAFIDEHRIPDDEMKLISEAIAWQKQASLAKQKKDRERGVFGT